MSYSRIPVIRVAALACSFFLIAACSVGQEVTTSQTINDRTERPAIERREQEICGWRLHIDTRLWKDEEQATRRAIELLQGQLEEIVRVVPKDCVAELQKVPLYFSPAYPGKQAGAEFHPDAGWLRNHGRDPVMARAVEFSNIASFEQECVRMPNFVLHELSHAYHFRVLPQGFDNPQIKAAYDRAKASGKYDVVERWYGNGRPNTQEKAYALSSPMEYFAESSEAYFGRNDFFPFNRAELEAHDPAMATLLQQLWK